jgi:hypothetical protein
MTPDAQRIAIAESVGWHAEHLRNRCDGTHIIRCGACGGHGHSNCYGNGTGQVHSLCWNNPCSPSAIPPDYLGDLNAMHEVEKGLGDSQWLTYESELERIVDRDNHHLTIQQLTCAQIHATASQRAEAYLRTIGKWSDNARGES